MVMNEQIQNLKDKLWTEEYWTNPNTDKLLPAQLNRFAELIVRECVQVGGPEDSYTDEWFKAKADSVNKIREHFGVEE
jgi:hypothetical protein